MSTKTVIKAVPSKNAPKTPAKEAPKTAPLIAPIAPPAIKPEEVKAEESKAIIDIFGQPKASRSASGILASFFSDKGATHAGIVSGPAGVGKSHLISAMRGAIEKEGYNIVYVPQAKALETADSDGMKDICQAFEDSAGGMKTAILIDEAHDLPLKSGPSGRFFSDFIYGGGEVYARRGQVQFRADTAVSFNSKNILFILITNMPERISKKNKQAIERRFLPIKLERYTDETMAVLIPQYFKEKGWSITNDATDKALRFHRGTFGALDCLLKALQGEVAISDGKPHITKDLLDRTTPLCTYTLRGFKWEEIKTLLWLLDERGQAPTKLATITLMFPGIDIHDFIRHCDEQKTKTKAKSGEKPRNVRTPFLELSTSGYKLSQYGNAFLEANGEAFRAALETNA